MTAMAKPGEWPDRTQPIIAGIAGAICRDFIPVPFDPLAWGRAPSLIEHDDQGGVDLDPIRVLHHPSERIKPVPYTVKLGAAEERLELGTEDVSLYGEVESAGFLKVRIALGCGVCTEESSGCRDATEPAEHLQIARRPVPDLPPGALVDLHHGVFEAGLERPRLVELLAFILALHATTLRRACSNSVRK